MSETLTLELTLRRWRLRIRWEGDAEFEFIIDSEAEVAEQVAAYSTHPDVRTVQCERYYGQRACGLWSRTPVTVLR